MDASSASPRVRSSSCESDSNCPAQIFAHAAPNSIGVILQGAAQNVGMFIAARGVIGFGLGISITAAPVLILELAYPTQRGAMTSLYNS